MNDVLPVSAADGHRFDLTLHAASPSAPLLLIGPAMGTPARVYTPFAQALAAQGISAAILELRGLGSSSLRAGRKADFGYRSLVEQDWFAAVTALRARYPQAPLFLFGHSLGGQASVLFASARPAGIAGVVMVACGSVFYRGWPGLKGLGILAFTQFAAVLSGLLGYFPGKRVGFGGTEAKTLMQDWARLARSGRFALAGGGTDYETLLPKLQLPVLGVSFDHDHFAPHAAQKNLLDKLTQAGVTHWALGPQDLGLRLDHFNWIKKNEALVARIAVWLRAQAGARA